MIDDDPMRFTGFVPVRITLWCNHTPGQNDIFAAPDRVTAKKRAAEHNAWLDRMFREGKMQFDGNWPTRAACTMGVIEWPWSAESHAEDLRKNVFATKATRQ